MIGIIDSTLREGEQMTGVYFTLAQKLEILRHLIEMNIDEVELGISTMSSDLPELLTQAIRMSSATRFALWCRGRLEDVRESAALKPDVLSISLPVSDLHISSRLQKDRAWVLRQIAVVTEEARACGVPVVSLGLEDATRADTGFLGAVLRQAQRAGVDRIRLADTVGVATPPSIVRMVKTARKSVSMQISVHTHNDFGMATANAIAALESGADWADVTILGLGERAGNARLEEVIGFLALNKRYPQYNTAELYQTCHAVASMTGLAISPHHPIIGKRIFSCESGLHLDGLAKNPATYEPFPPEKVRAVRKHVLGKKAGRNAVLAHLQAMGLQVSREDVEVLTSQIRTQSYQLGRPLSNEEIAKLTADVQSAATPTPCAQTN